MIRLCVLTLSALLLSSNALAQWELVNEESTVNYVSVKNSSVGEVNSFQELSGSIERNGAFSVDIDLGSVETNIPIRNDRVKAMLFEIASFATANISAQLDPSSFNEINVGETYESSISFDLSLHGVSTEMTTVVRVVKLADNRILALSVNPIIVNADPFNLSEGIGKLREVANLSSISTVVPVTFSLVFQQQ